MSSSALLCSVDILPDVCTNRLLNYGSLLFFLVIKTHTGRCGLKMGGICRCNGLLVMKKKGKKKLPFFLFERLGCHLLGSVVPYTLEQNC